MSSVRIRKPFAAAFAVLLVAAGYLGLSSQKIPQYGHSDKGLHFVTFFILTGVFYFILEISRRRVLHLTLIVCTGVLSIGSELVQGYLPNGRIFDPFDIVANVAGSGLAVTLCAWYHKRMLERKRKNKHFDILPGDEDYDDVELGEGPGPQEQESGIVAAHEAPETRPTDVTDELDHWDENAEDWEEDGGVEQDATNSVQKDGAEANGTKKRAD